MDKYTAGPWYITASSPYGIVYGADHTVIVPHYPIGYTTEQQWANARLTASAPELLEALETVVAEVLAGVAVTLPMSVIAKAKGE